MKPYYVKCIKKWDENVPHYDKDIYYLLFVDDKYSNVYLLDDNGFLQSWSIKGYKIERDMEHYFDIPKNLL